MTIAAKIVNVPDIFLISILILILLFFKPVNSVRNV